MKHLMIAAMLLATPALASPEDEYIACLVGRSAVALSQQGGVKDAEKAQQSAYELCEEPAEFAPDTELDGLQDYVAIMVERMAAE
jgi:hypothetical protein